MTESAYEWGVRHKSCREALEQRHALGPDATQADWYLGCKRGDWLIWQLANLPKKTQRRIAPALRRAITRIVARAIRRGIRSLWGMRSPKATAWRRWARRWLSREDRTSDAARAATEVAVDEAEEAVDEAEEAAWVIAEDAARAATEVAVDEAAEWAAEAAEAYELRLQAHNIRREIPTWPGEGTR